MTTIKKSLGKALAEFRKELGVRQEDLEALTGVNQRTISTFENDRSNNYQHVYLYLAMCETQEQIDAFHEVLNDVFDKELV